MGWHIIKRLLQAVPVLLGIATITFFIIHLAPGDPMEMLLDPRIRERRNINPEMIEMLRKKYGLDQPVHVQYVKWVNNLVHGDLGESFSYRRPVSSLIAERIPYTLQLSILALLFDALIGVAIGIIAAVKQ